MMHGPHSTRLEEALERLFRRLLPALKNSKRESVALLDERKAGYIGQTVTDVDHIPERDGSVSLRNQFID
jgi:hypothetical protein